MSTTISGTSGVTFPDSTSMQTGQQACKAWVNFNGTGTVAIRESYNVSSITDNGTGLYTVNFTTAMPDLKFSASALSGLSGATIRIANNTTAFTTTSFQVQTVNSAGSDLDSPNVCVTIFSN